MAENKNIKTIPMSAEGELMLEFDLFYHTGSYDHSRSGKELDSIELPDSSIHRSYSLKDGNIPSVIFDKKSKRGSSKSENKKETLLIGSSAPLPLIIHDIEVDEYHPDYYNELDLGEDCKPTINNTHFEYHVVASTEII